MCPCLNPTGKFISSDTSSQWSRSSDRAALGEGERRRTERLDTYVRAECSDATVILDHQEIERSDHDPDSIVKAKPGDGTIGPLEEYERVGDRLLIKQFADWLDGGNPMPTNVHDNLRSVAMMEAAMRSRETNEAINVPALIEETRREVRAEL